MNKNTPPQAQENSEGLLLRRLGSLAELSTPELAKVKLLHFGRSRHSVRSELYAEGELCPARFIVSGWGARYRILADGRRQIVSLLLPGDMIGPILRPQLRSQSAGIALTGMETIDVGPLIEHADAVAPSHSGLSRALHMLDRLDEIGLRNQILRLGRQTAYERTLHLLLELRERLFLAGLEASKRYPMPLTQDVLADVLGITVVHLNRTLQQARREGLIEIRAGVVTLHDVGRIEAIVDWQPMPTATDWYRTASQSSSLVNPGEGNVHPNRTYL